MSNPTLQNALNNCIERLASGQTIEQCLTMYPELASELRPLLEAGQASSNLRADRSELSAMHNRLDPKIERLIADTNFNQRPPLRLPVGSFVLVASLIAVFIGIGIIFRGDTLITGEQPTATLTSTPAETQVTPAPTLMQITPSVTSTPATPDAVTTELTPLPDSASCTPPLDWLEYRVATGDTLSFIAINAGTTVEDLQIANCLDSTIIVVGQTLFVPSLWENTSPSDANNSNNPSADNNSPNNSDSSDDDVDDDDASDDSDDDEDDDLDDEDDSDDD